MASSARPLNKTPDTKEEKVGLLTAPRITDVEAHARGISGLPETGPANVDFWTLRRSLKKRGLSELKADFVALSFVTVASFKLKLWWGWKPIDVSRITEIMHDSNSGGFQHEGENKGNANPARLAQIPNSTRLTLEQIRGWVAQGREGKPTSCPGLAASRAEWGSDFKKIYAPTGEMDRGDLTNFFNNHPALMKKLDAERQAAEAAAAAEALANPSRWNICGRRGS